MFMLNMNMLNMEILAAKSSKSRNSMLSLMREKVKYFEDFTKFYISCFCPTGKGIN